MGYRENPSPCPGVGSCPAAQARDESKIASDANDAGKSAAANFKRDRMRWLGWASADPVGRVAHGWLDDCIGMSEPSVIAGRRR